MAEESMKMCIRVSIVPSLVSRRVVNFAAAFLTSFMAFTYVLFCAFFQLQMSGDIKINPGPGPVKHPRLICCFPVKQNHCAVLCDDCQRWTHCSCCCFDTGAYKLLVNSLCEFTWLCSVCLDKIFLSCTAFIILVVKLRQNGMVIILCVYLSVCLQISGKATNNHGFNKLVAFKITKGFC